MITHNITLRVKNQNAVDTGIAVSQGDYGRVKLVIYVKDGETYLSGAETAELAFTTPNGYIVTGNVTIETGAYSYIFQGNELQAAGKVSAVLTLTFSDGRVSTCGFLFMCRYNPMYDRNMDAGPYLGEIETLKSAAQFALEDARGAAAVAEAAKEAAVSAANNAEAVSGVGIATSQKAGLVKPDGSTTSVDAEGILSIILKDTQGILGTENATVMIQALIDAIADKVMNQVLTKAMLINNGLTTESGKYPLDAAYGKTLLDLYTKLNSDPKINKIYPNGRKSSDLFNDIGNTGIIISPFKPDSKCIDWISSYGVSILIKYENYRYAVIQICNGNPPSVYVKADGDINSIDNMKYLNLSGTSVDSPTAP